MSSSAAQGRSLSLCVSIVTFQPHLEQLRALLRTLGQALTRAAAELPLVTQVLLIDNGDSGAALTQVLAAELRGVPARLHASGDNLGYGAGHNIAIRASGADYHLVLNPDVELAPDCVLEGLRFLQQHPDVVALSPRVLDTDGHVQYLCKTYPSLFTLLLRGFAPSGLRRRFGSRLSRYECRALVDANEVAEVPLISGCFMLCRSSALQRSGGFNERFFLYFEDFALSLELAKQGRLVYQPACVIRHHGGYAARKGWRHLAYFVRSAWQFFSLYGWKLV